MTISIAFVCSKGGVGKTTLAANVAAFLASNNAKTLMIDVETQPGISSYYDLETRADKGLTHVITVTDNLEQCISTTQIPNLDLVYSDDPNGDLAIRIRDMGNGHKRLFHAIKEFRKLGYDYIILDSQGAKGPLQDTALIASDILVCPIKPDLISAQELSRGTFSRVATVRKDFQFEGIVIPDLNVVINAADMRYTNTGVMIDAITDLADKTEHVNLLRTDKGERIIIPHAEPFQSAATLKMPAHEYEPRTNSKRGSAHEIIEQLTRSITALEKGGEHA